MKVYGFRAYYAHDVKAPKKAGDLAIDVRWDDPHGRDMEAGLAAARPDIGQVTKYTITPNPYYTGEPNVR